MAPSNYENQGIGTGWMTYTQRQPNNFSRALDFAANASRPQCNSFFTNYNSIPTNYNQSRDNKSYYHQTRATINRIEYYNIQNEIWCSFYHGAWGYSTSLPMPSGFFPPMAHYINEPYNMYNPYVPPPLYYYDQKLYWRIINQVNYYFSDENLFKDTFLKRNMDNHGWVWITLIASFPRIQQLTNDIGFILFALKGSSFVEVWGEKIRRKTKYMGN